MSFANLLRQTANQKNIVDDTITTNLLILQGSSTTDTVSLTAAQLTQLIADISAFQTSMLEVIQRQQAIIDYLTTFAQTYRITDSSGNEVVFNPG